MNIKSILAISGIILVTALGTCWIITPPDPTPEELYRQYMQLSPVERMEVKYTLLAKAAHAGHLPAIWQMAEEPCNSGLPQHIQEQDYYFWIKKAADQGDPKGQLKAFYLLDLPGIQSLDYLSKAAGQSYGPALLKLGRLYASGNKNYGIARNEQKALELYRKAAEANDPDALYLIYLLTGVNVLPAEGTQKKHDIYQRYLAAAKQVKGDPYPPFDDMQELTTGLYRKAMELLERYMGDHEQVKPLLEKYSKTLEEDPFGKNQKYMDPNALNANWRYAPGSSSSAERSSGNERLPDCRDSLNSRTMAAICSADRSGFPSISSSTSNFISPSRWSGSSR